MVNPLSLEELLNEGAGIFVFNRNNLSQGDKITIRGIGTRAQFGVRGIKIFLDGIPMTFPDGQSQLNNINVQEIENVEILLGPSSVIYGNSLGGAILLRSKKNKKNMIDLHPSFSIGSFGQKKYSLSSSYNFHGNGIKLGGYYNESTGFRDHSNAKFFGLNLSADFRLTQNFGIALIGNYYNAPYLLNPSTLNKVQSKKNPTSVRNSVFNFATAKSINQLQSGIKLNYSISEKNKLSTTFYFISRELDNSIPGRFIDLKKNYGGVRIEYVGNMTLLSRDVEYLTGIDYEIQRDKRSEFTNEGIDDPLNIDPGNIFNEINYTDLLVDQNENVNSLGIFSHINVGLTENLKLFVGIRYDDFLFNFKNILTTGNDNEIRIDNLSAMGGFSFIFVEPLSLYGNYSTGFQTPTANEFSNNPFSEGGFNRSLNPEFVRNYELGIRGILDKPDIIYRLSAFYMDFSDLLISYQSEQEETFYRNAGKADNSGIELTVEYYPTSKSKISASYNFMSYKFKDYSLIRDFGGGTRNYQLKGKYVPGVPKNNLMLSFKYNFSNYLFSIIDINYTGKYFANDFNGPLPNSEDEIDNYVNDSFTKVDFSTVYTHNFSQFEIILRLKIENIFDERFNQSIVPNAFGNNFFEPSPGRSFYLGISAGF